MYTTVSEHETRMRHPPARPRTVRPCTAGNTWRAVAALLLLVAASTTARADDPTPLQPAPAPQAGTDGRYLDNGDGTISDRTTGLMWEKKCADCAAPHDVEEKYHWSGDGKVETLWDWLDRVNAEGGSGLGGHDDWRVPNVKELVSIVDYARFDPALAPAFHTPACEEGCDEVTEPACSCTAIDLYWTSTTFADFPAHALIVDVGYGFVDDRLKTDRHHVRAVRGGNVRSE